jgi:phosphatidylinositol alpha-1,6-mannosyltransferase
VKVLVVSNEFPPGPGGIGTHAHELSREGARRGWQVTVVTNQDYVDADEAEDFRRRSELRIEPIPRHGFAPAGLATRARAIRDALREGPDVAIATGRTSVWLLALLSRGTPWVAIGHGTEFVTPQRWRQAVNRWAFGRADAVVCVSGFTAGRLVAARIRPRRLEVIPNGADDDRFGPDPEDGARFRAAHGLGDRPLILTVGNVSERTGQAVGVRALARGPGALAEAHYLIAGLPTREREIRELAEEVGVADRVHLLGRVPAADLPAAYNAADVFAMTSRQVAAGDVEGYGIAVVEAALAGRPAVVTSDSGLAEAVIDGETGVVVPQDDDAATARALQSLLDDPDRRAAQGRRARERATSELTWRSLVGRYDEILTQVARPDPRVHRTLTVISDTPYYLDGGVEVGWGPNVRELDQLATLFDEVRHVAPLYDEAAPGSALATRRTDCVRLHPVVPAGGRTLVAKLRVLARYPAWSRAIRREVAGADLVHVRCPSNISLLALGLVTSRRRRPPLWLKYGGNWRPSGPEPWTYRLQRTVLRRGLRDARVTVNGDWPDEPAHVLAFRNPTLTPEELVRGRAAADKVLDEPARLVFVGRLDRAKGANRSVEITALLRQRSRAVCLDVIGDGREMGAMRAAVAAHGIEDAVTFHGWLPRPALEPLYAAAHLLLLPSDSEGFPKVLSEAMAFGVVPLAGAVSSIPQALAELKTGKAVDPADVAGFADAVEEYLDDPEAWAEASRHGVEGADVFAYGGYLRDVTTMARETWGLELRTTPSGP